jgi:hypothetical protein
MSYHDFMTPLEAHLRQLIVQSASSEISSLRGVVAVAGKRSAKKKRSRRKPGPKAAKKRVSAKRTSSKQRGKP